mmetsp:Transcript_34350/g.75034  ORF Transcript_34350/g.75034 Transcript_34350/m.75034 type:complete len:309 (+) Transcript_34350:709-1635(+)
MVVRGSNGLTTSANHSSRVPQIRDHEPQGSAQLGIAVEQSRHCRGTHLLEFFSLRCGEDLSVCLDEGLFDGLPDLLVSGCWLHLLLPELAKDVSVELLGRMVGDLCSAMAVEHGKVHSQFLHCLVGDVSVLERLLQARPTLGVHSQAKRLGCDVVALLLFLQGLCSRVDRQRLSISPEHHHLEGTGPVVLLSRFVQNLAALLKVDRVRRRAANDILAVNEEAFASLLSFLRQGHDEAETLLRVPLLHLALVLGLLLFHWLRWLRLRPGRLLRHDLLNARRRLVLRRCRVAAFVKLDEFSRLDRLAHLL